MNTLEAKTVVPLYAGFWRRAAASFLDGLILLVPNIIVTLLVPGEIAKFLAQLLVNLATPCPSPEAYGRWSCCC